MRLSACSLLLLGCRAAGFGALVALGLACRCWNWSSVFADGAAFFIDGDCYARMTRAAIVLNNPGTIVRHHEFENWPEGTSPHTTAPLDYLIVGLAHFCNLLPVDWRGGAGALDFAGAIVGPVLAVAGMAGIALAWPRRWPGRWIVLVAFAAMPPVAWAGVLGRPDHQALLVPLLAIASIFSARVCSGPERGGVAVASGLCWGMALWVSLFEPLIFALLGLVAAVSIAGRQGMRERWPVFRGFLTALTIPAFCLIAIDRPAITVPGGSKAFDRWAAWIPELGRGSLADILSWAGAGVGLIPLGLAFIPRGDQRRRRLCSAGLGIFLVLIALALWQRRWAPYAALGMALLAPLALPNLALLLRLASWPRWARLLGGLAIFLLIVWHPLEEWDRLLFSKHSLARREEALADGIALRRVALAIRKLHEGRAAPLPESHPSLEARRKGILAPFWLCPPLAYWSGVPAVAGTSHQSLPGIMATAEFFFAEDWLDAARVIDARRVRWVVSDVAERVVPVARSLLGLEPRGETVGLWLERFGADRQQDPDWLLDRGRAGWFRLFEVDSNGGISPEASRRR